MYIALSTSHTLHCLMKNSKVYLKHAQHFVNFTVVVHYLVNKLDHPPQHYGFWATA